MSGALLSPSAMALYERLVTLHSLPIDAVDADGAAMAELLAAGFARLDGNPPGRLLPEPPLVAFEGVLSALQAEFVDQHRQMLDAYAYLDGLQADFLARQPNGADTLADVRPTPGAFGAAVRELLSEAKQEVLRWNIAAHAEPSDSLPARTVYDAGFLHRKGAEVLRQASSVGDAVRLADSLPCSMLIIDDAAAALPLGSREDGAVVLRSSLVVAALTELFDIVWQRCVPWIDRDRPDEGLTPAQRHVVALLAVGRSDEEIAEDLGVSLRTVRRHVADLMDRLQATTRFAAGVAAARAGLLDDVALQGTIPPIKSARGD